MSIGPIGSQEVKAGKMLAGMDMNTGGRPSKNLSHDVTRLSDMGINRKQSSRWQLLATIPDETLEERTSSNRRIVLLVDTINVFAG
jgi:hypothetical protein